MGGYRWQAKTPPRCFGYMKPPTLEKHTRPSVLPWQGRDTQGYKLLQDSKKQQKRSLQARKLEKPQKLKFFDFLQRREKAKEKQKVVASKGEVRGRRKPEVSSGWR